MSIEKELIKLDKDFWTKAFASDELDRMDILVDKIESVNDKLVRALLIDLYTDCMGQINVKTIFHKKRKHELNCRIINVCCFELTRGRVVV